MLIKTLSNQKEDQAHWDYIGDLCCRTGANGAPIDRLRWKFFKDTWVTPYRWFYPSLAWVVFDETLPIGYLIAASDSQSFWNRRLWIYDTWILFRLWVLRAYPLNGDTRRFWRRYFKFDHGPEDSFPEGFKKKLFLEYPAHLHMNVESGIRSKGVGRALMGALENSLKQQGVTGVHLFCGPSPLGFYQKMGFNLLEQIEFKPGVPVYCLGKKI